MKSKLSTAKKSKTTTFSRVFYPKKIDNFFGNPKLKFWTKNEDFEQCEKKVTFLKYYKSVKSIMQSQLLKKKIHVPSQAFIQKGGCRACKVNLCVCETIVGPIVDILCRHAHLHLWQAKKEKVKEKAQVKNAQICPLSQFCVTCLFWNFRFCYYIHESMN